MIFNLFPSKKHKKIKPKFHSWEDDAEAIRSYWPISDACHKVLHARNSSKKAKTKRGSALSQR